MTPLVKYWGARASRSPRIDTPELNHKVKTSDRFDRLSEATFNLYIFDFLTGTYVIRSLRNIFRIRTESVFHVSFSTDCMAIYCQNRVQSS